MPKRNYKPEEIIQHLRTIEIERSKGATQEEAARKVGISYQTLIRWQKEYGSLKLDQIKRLKELEKENARLKRIVADQAIDLSILKEVSKGKLLSPARRRKAVLHIMRKLHFSERRVCRAINQVRSTQRYKPSSNPFKENLRERVIALAKEYGRYGYRTITSMLKMEGWNVGKDRVYTIWREEGLKVPAKQPKRGRLWLNDGSCIRKRAECKNHVWSYNFIFDRTHDGRTIKILNIIDEYTRECLATYTARRIRSQDVILVLADLFLKHGIPKYIRSDNVPEFISERLRNWFATLEVHPLFIEPGSPWENGYIESFNGKMRDQFLNGEIFYSLKEAQVLIERWRRHYNNVRPHSSLGGVPPVPETVCLRH
ncbi:IS3 family transposase [Spirochaetota bacterium]